MFVALVAAKYAGKDFNLRDYKTLLSIQATLIPDAYLLADEFEHERPKQHPATQPPEHSFLTPAQAKLLREFPELRETLMAAREEIERRTRSREQRPDI